MVWKVAGITWLYALEGAGKIYDLEGVGKGIIYEAILSKQWNIVIATEKIGRIKLTEKNVYLSASEDYQYSTLDSKFSLKNYWA